MALPGIKKAKKSLAALFYFAAAMRLDVAAGGTGTASACGRRISALQGNCGVHHKSHVGHFYFYAANLGKKFLINAKRKSSLIELCIRIGRPIQGQS